MKTIPKTRRRGNRMDLPVYKELVSAMSFDPDQTPKTQFTEWDLDQTYPPTVGELVGYLSRHAVSDQEESDGQQQEGEQAPQAGGGGEHVPGGPEDGGPVGADGSDHLDQDAGGA